MHKYEESLDYSRLQKLSWKVYQWLPSRLAARFRRLRPQFADNEGSGVLWFGLHCVQRREGGGLVTVGDSCRIEGTLVCHLQDAQISIGARSSIGGETVVESMHSVSIGDDCLVSDHVNVQDHDSHSLEWEHRSQDVLSWLAARKEWAHVQQADVIIEMRCWIAAHCVILKGVHLGEGCVVGAGSIVTRSFPAYSLIAGNPARFIRSLPVPPDYAEAAVDRTEQTHEDSNLP